MSYHEDIRLEEVGPASGHYDSPNRRTHARANSTPSGSGLRQRLHRQNSAPVREQWEQDIMDQLPSRQLGRNATLRWNRTVRGKRGHGPNFQQALDQMDTATIVDNLLQDEEFQEETLEQKAEEIRDLRTNLANKKSIKQKLREADERKQKQVGWVDFLRSSVYITWRHFKRNLAELGYAFELWRGHLKVIEGKFGSGVTSYFIFLKWLLLLNIPMFIILFSFITIPQLLHRLSQDHPYQHNATFTGIEILTGEGWFNETELYYGVYTNETIDPISGIAYEMPLAYLLTIAAYYFLTLVVLLYSLTKSYRKNFINASDNLKLKFVTKVFNGWDFAITQNPELRHENLCNELREYLSTVKDQTVHRTSGQKCGMFFLRIFTNLIVLALIGGAGYLVFFISSTDALSNLGVSRWAKLALPAAISGLVLVLPFAFALISDFENFEDPRVGIYLTMARMIVLFCGILGVMVWYWFSKANENECWENILGATIYRLVIVDFVVILLVTFFSEFARKLMSLCCSCVRRPEFNIGRNTLYLIYSQALIWLGTYYSPLLTIIAIIKLIVIFYVKRYSVTQNCRPLTKAWRGAQAHTIIMTLLGISLLLCFIAVGYSIIRLKPSTGCGPYMNQDTAYDVMAEKMKDLAEKEEIIAQLISFVTSSGFLAGVITALIIVAYYSRIRAKGLDEMVESLRAQIANEIEYKKKLTKILQQQGPALRQGRRDERVGEDGPISPGGRKFAKQTFSPQATDANDNSKDHRHRGGPKSNQITASSHSSSPPGAPPVGDHRNSSASGSVHPGAPPQPRASTLEPPAPGAAAGSRSSEPRDVYNDGFVDKSWDPDDYYSPPESGVNRMYDDRSTDRRPNLPYSGQHYDLYHPDKP